MYSEPPAVCIRWHLFMVQIPVQNVQRLADDGLFVWWVRGQKLMEALASRECWQYGWTVQYSEVYMIAINQHRIDHLLREKRYPRMEWEGIIATGKVNTDGELAGDGFGRISIVGIMSMIEWTCTKILMGKYGIYALEIKIQMEICEKANLGPPFNGKFM